uniref:Saposin B-type domain-containing protein n=1 Tax=Chenopodium quinoa TaxID=63459 RepID=A0A803MDA4_CHEQI
MAKQSLIALNLAVLIILISCAQISDCLKKPETSARKEDIPFIKCQVCQKLASELYSQVQMKKDAQISPKKITEFEVIEIVENVCNLKKEEADWILKIDIVEKGDQLELVDQDVEGQCNSKCKTIERACQEIIGFSDTDIAEYIYARKPQLDSLVNYLCKDLTKACSKRPPPVPKDRVPGEPFLPKPEKEAEMEKMMRSMQGKAFKEKGKKKGDWKEKVLKHVTNTGKTLKTHANRVSHRLRKWWKSKTSVASKKKSTGNKAEL